MHPRVTYHTAGLEGLTGVDGSDLREMERAAILEVANHLDVESVTVDGRDDEGILVISYKYRPTQRQPMPYDTLYVYSDGKIAEAAINHPVKHRSFRELVEDVRFETKH